MSTTRTRSNNVKSGLLVACLLAIALLLFTDPSSTKLPQPGGALSKSIQG